MSQTVMVSPLALASSSSDTRPPPSKRRDYDAQTGGQVADEDELYAVHRNFEGSWRMTIRTHASRRLVTLWWDFPTQ
eukprot:2566142-Amphidinium_carterae.1